MQLFNEGFYYLNDSELISGKEYEARFNRNDSDKAREGTIAYGILKSHNKSDSMKDLSLRFDSLASHDITYVGIIQTARASGMTEFNMPYVLTNCHNSLCAVGGTINEDDHKFALSAARKYGGIYVPPMLSVIHSFNREMMAGCGKMILASDSHTRYGAVGTMGVGEGGGELAKQLLGKTYDIQMPEIVGIYLKGSLKKGVGPHDVALSLVGSTYPDGFVKNRVLEFIGPGVHGLSMEYRNAIDVMTTETTCLSSIWVTDDKTREYLLIHGREDEYKALSPESLAYYDRLIVIDLDEIRPMIALPFHPSNVYEIEDFNENMDSILKKTDDQILEQFGSRNITYSLRSKIHKHGFHVDQGIVGGCSGGNFDSLTGLADILDGENIGNGSFSLSVYPGSQPILMELLRNGCAEKIISSGAVIRECFCGPCFGAGDTPANGEFSIRHTTRNFPNREGSKPGEGQLAGVALMDAFSIGATAVNKGRLTPATALSKETEAYSYHFDPSIYEKRLFDGRKIKDKDAPLVMGPNIKDWPDMPSLSDRLLLRVVSYITDEVTTTDELIPSGETSSFRSNPIRLSEFALSRKDPDYVPKAKEIQAIETSRRDGADPSQDPVIGRVFEQLKGYGLDVSPKDTLIESTIYANKPGDGSAREQAASCQRVLGAGANLAKEYATKRYRSNLINWGILPFITDDPSAISNGDHIYFEGLISALERNEDFKAYLVKDDSVKEITLTIGSLTEDEKQILKDGCLINFYKEV
ncbi:MAG: hydratase [Clostridia bacterium]|nr:hydratase [Clostridia bacterium]